MPHDHMITTQRKLWHGISEPARVCGPSETPGKPIKSLVAIRSIAMKQATEASATHPRFRCPGCHHTFLLTYGRMARDQWPHEYEFWCLDCIRDLVLDREHGGTAKRSTAARGISLLDK